MAKTIEKLIDVEQVEGQEEDGGEEQQVPRENISATGKAVQVQSRNPLRGRFIKDPDKFYYVVDLEGGNRAPNFVSPINDLLGDESPLHPGEPKWDDIGHQPGICTSLNQTVLVCSMADYHADSQKSAVESTQRALGKFGVQRLHAAQRISTAVMDPAGEIGQNEARPKGRTVAGHWNEVDVQRDPDPETRY